MKQALAIALLALFAGCSTSNSSERRDQTLTLRYGESATLSGTSTTITFAAIDDSRCPQGVICVWAGDAAVTLTSDDRSFVLHTASNVGPSFAEIGGAKITLFGVQPHRVTPEAILKSDYVVQLDVRWP